MFWAEEDRRRVAVLPAWQVSCLMPSATVRPVTRAWPRPLPAGRLPFAATSPSRYRGAGVLVGGPEEAREGIKNHGPERPIPYLSYPAEESTCVPLPSQLAAREMMLPAREAAQDGLCGLARALVKI
jgi:hypothetical protein